MDDVLRVHCEDPTAATSRVTDTLRAHGVDVKRVEETAPTLEDAFVALTDPATSLTPSGVEFTESVMS
jgi:hypothetical protein